MQQGVDLETCTSALGLLEDRRQRLFLSSAFSPEHEGHKIECSLCEAAKVVYCALEALLLQHELQVNQHIQQLRDAVGVSDVRAREFTKRFLSKDSDDSI